MKILYIEACNYIDFPVGGQLTYAKQMCKAFGNELYLVGISTDRLAPVGKWVKIKIDGIKYNFFALHRANKIAGKPLIPRRLLTYIYLKLNKGRILVHDFDFAYCRSPEIIIAVRNWKLSNLTYHFAGMGNSLSISRRWYGRLFARFYYPLLFPALKKVDLILAAADEQSIRDTIAMSKGILNAGSICQFPTRIDTDIFKLRDKLSCRMDLDILPDQIVIVTTGRLHYAKGWKLLMDAFNEFQKVYTNSAFYFIGDGNSRSNIEAYISEIGLTEKVVLPGFQPPEIISRYLSLADLYVMGSMAEGWATSLIEAKACGIPICTTDFSSARDIVSDGIDGFVVDDRDYQKFAQCMIRAISIKIPFDKLEIEMGRYALHNLRSDLINYWRSKNCFNSSKSEVVALLTEGA